MSFDDGRLDGKIVRGAVRRSFGKSRCHTVRSLAFYSPHPKVVYALFLVPLVILTDVFSPQLDLNGSEISRRANDRRLSFLAG